MNLHRPGHPWRKPPPRHEIEARRLWELKRRERNTDLRERDAAVRRAMQR